MRQNALLPDSRVGHVLDLTFSLNISFVCWYTLLAKGYTFFETRYAPAPRIAFKYFFLRSVARFNSLLSLKPDDRIGQELTFAISVVGVALLVWALISLLKGAAIFRLLFNSTIGLIAIFAVPASLLYTASLVFSARALEPVSFWSNPINMIFAGDCLVVCVLLWFGKDRPLHLAAYGPLITLHYTLWTFLFWLWPAPARLVSPAIFVVILGASGVVWLLYLRESRLNASGHGPYIWKIAWGLASLAILLALWFPAGRHVVAHPKDYSSLVITMERQGCFGHCPVYSVTINGSGIVNYDGIRDVGVKGPQAANISRTQLDELLRSIDAVGFFRLDDRAFERCADTPTVSIGVFIDGKQKTVRSDAFCVGAATGPQARFVELTNQIDRHVNSGQWVHKESGARKDFSGE